MIIWHFIPLNAPNVGEIWEAGVKMTKVHLCRIIGNVKLTFEALCTVLAQIEAILNSKLLTQLSSDLEDLQALTPGHFLIGKRITAIPDPDVSQVQQARLSQWQHLVQLQQHFWACWSKEYRSKLQQRTKWRKNCADIKIGSLVIVKNENSPPLHWQFGRVVDVYTGSGDVVRVVKIKTVSGVFKRPITKICPLPVHPQ